MGHDREEKTLMAVFQDRENVGCAPSFGGFWNVPHALQVLSPKPATRSGDKSRTGCLSGISPCGENALAGHRDATYAAGSVPHPSATLPDLPSLPPRKLRMRPFGSLAFAGQHSHRRLPSMRMQERPRATLPEPWSPGFGFGVKSRWFQGHSPSVWGHTWW